MTAAVSGKWEDVRIKWVLMTLESGRREVSDTDSFEGGALSIGGEHIGWKGEWLLDNRRYISRDFYSTLNTGKVRVGDVLLVKDGATIGKVAIAESLPSDEVAVNEHVFLLRILSDHDPKFYFYVVQSQFLQSQIQLEVRGAAQPGLNSEFKNVVVVPRPPKEFQTAIAKYLDAETAEIDILIAEKERMLALLEEKRAALITHAVTRGLAPNVSLKPSGLDWFGGVPAHWRVERLKFHLAQRIEQGWSPVCENRLAEEDEWAVLKVGCVNGVRFNPEEQKALPSDLEPVMRYEIQENDILLSRGNTLELVGSASVVPRVRPRLLLCDLLYRCRVDTDSVHPEFAVNQLRSIAGRFQIEREASGTSGSMKKIGQETIQNFVLFIPSLEEQDQILNKIKATTLRIDSIRDVTTDSIRLLRERRNALITAAVTGQISIEEMTE